MDFNLTENQQTIRDTILKVAGEFDDSYWLEKDKAGGFPEESTGTTYLRSQCLRLTAPRGATIFSEMRLRLRPPKPRPSIHSIC